MLKNSTWNVEFFSEGKSRRLHQKNETRPQGRVSFVEAPGIEPGSAKNENPKQLAFLHHNPKHPATLPIPSYSLKSL